MASWRTAKSLDTLRAQVNAQWPGRKKDSDGTIGDASHSSRTSDHNPNPAGVVCAMDITHDPQSGCDAGALAATLLTSRDKRIKYVIWNRQITAGSDGPSPWKARKYTGTNPHDHHCHISVKGSAALYDDTALWAIAGNVIKPPYVPPPPPARPTIMEGSTGAAVRELQGLLGNVTVDGYFGPATVLAVKAFQRANKLVADGKVGSYTWEALLKHTPSTKETTMPATPARTTVPVTPAVESKINWTQAIAVAASLLTLATGNKINLTPETQVMIVTGITTVQGVVTWVLRTWFTKSITPSAVAKRAS